MDRHPGVRRSRAMSDTQVQHGLEGVVAFDTKIAEPDKEGSALRYRGVDIEDLVGRAHFATAWGPPAPARLGAAGAPARISAPFPPPALPPGPRPPPSRIRSRCIPATSGFTYR